MGREWEGKVQKQRSSEWDYVRLIRRVEIEGYVNVKGKDKDKITKLSGEVIQKDFGFGLNSIKEDPVVSRYMSDSV